MAQGVPNRAVLSLELNVQGRVHRLLQLAAASTALTTLPHMSSRCTLPWNPHQHDQLLE